MASARGRWAHALLLLFGLCGGLVLFEAGARVLAAADASRQGRLDRDLGKLKTPDRGAPATLGQMIRRSEDPRIVYELKPRLDVTFAGGHVTTGDAANRGPDPGPKTPRRLRIVGIGDSYMFGQGVSDDETYLSRLPALLSATAAIETVNLAVPGYNTAMEVAALERRLTSIHPDLVLIEVVGNDLDLPNFLWKDVDVWSLRRSFLFDFIGARLRRASPGAPLGGLVEAPKADESGESGFAREALDRVPAKYADMVGLPGFGRAIARLSSFGRRDGFPVVALTHGVWFEDDLRATLDREGIPLVILRSDLRQRARALGAPDYARSPLALSPRDLHPSALGHEVVAEILARELASRLPAGR